MAVGCDRRVGEHQEGFKETRDRERLARSGRDDRRDMHDAAGGAVVAGGFVVGVRSRPDAEGERRDDDGRSDELSKGGSPTHGRQG